jgi:ATP-dependent RNA helicase DDX27
MRKDKNRKLSGKDKRKLDASRERSEGKVWKKGKALRKRGPTMQGRAKGNSKAKPEKVGEKKVRR